MRVTSLAMCASIFIFTLGIQSCGDKDEEVTTCSPALTLPSFSGITETDGSGIVNGTTDATDWGFDTDWNAAEKGLFPGFSSYDLTCENTDNNEVFPAFPNGFDQTFSFLLNKASSTLVRMRLVRPNGEIVSSVDEGTSATYLFNLEEVLESDDAIFRLYYVLEQEDGCAFYGHGDVMVNQ